MAEILEFAIFDDLSPRSGTSISISVHFDEYETHDLTWDTTVFSSVTDDVYIYLARVSYAEVVPLPHIFLPK